VPDPGAIPAFLTTPVRQFYEHFLTLPREGGAVWRHHFRPEKIPALMPYLVVFEREAEDVMRIRLLSAGLADLVSNNSTGQNFLDRVPVESRPLFRSRFTHAASTPCGLYALLGERLANGHIVGFEVLTLPFHNDRGPNRLFISAAAPIEPPMDPQIKAPGVESKVDSARYVDTGAGIGDLK